jgi:hypothetical protein
MEGMMCAHGYDNWKQSNPADAELGPEYECCECHGFFPPELIREVKVRDFDYDGELDDATICLRCHAILTHRENAFKIATLIVRMGK